MNRTPLQIRHRLAAVCAALLLTNLVQSAAPAFADGLRSCLLRTPEAAASPADPWTLGLAAPADSTVFTRLAGDSASPAVPDSTARKPALGPGAAATHHKSSAPKIGMFVGVLLGTAVGVSLSRGTPHTPSTGDGWQDLGNSIGDSVGDAVNDTGRIIGLSLLGGLFGYAIGSAIASEPQPPIGYTPPNPKTMSVARADSTAADSSAAR